MILYKGYNIVHVLSFITFYTLLGPMALLFGLSSTDVTNGMFVSSTTLRPTAPPSLLAPT